MPVLWHQGMRTRCAMLTGPLWSAVHDGLLCYEMARCAWWPLCYA